MKNRPLKGAFNYLTWQKKFTIIRTAAYFGIVLAIFFAGLITTKSRNNLLTVVAILGVLPAGKSLVNTIMYVRFKPVSEEFHKKIQPFENDIHIFYNMLVSSQEKIHYIDCMAIYDHSVYMYSSSDKISEKDMEKYLKNILSNHGKGNVNVKLYKSEKEFLNRLTALKELGKKEDAEGFENKITEIIGTFCL